MARDLRLFYLFRLLATSYLWAPIFFHFMGSRGLGFDEIMLLSALYSAVVMLVEVPTGAFADRIGRRYSMMAGALAMVASCITAYFAHGFALFAVAEVLAAVSMSLCSGADSAYLFDLLQEHGRGDEYPRRESTASAWHLAGNALAFAAGGLLGQLDLALPYLVTAGVASLAFLVALLMRDERRRPAAATDLRRELGAYFRHMGAAVRDVHRNARLRWIIAYSAVVFVLLRATIFLYQPYLAGRGFSIAETGLVYAAVYLVAACVAHRADALRRRLGEETLVWGLLGSLALSFVLLNQFGGPWAIGLLALQAMANGLYSPLVKPLMNREISDSARRATVLSIESIARRSAMGAFSPVAGFYGAHSAIYLCGAIGLVGFGALALAAHLGALRRRAALMAAAVPVAVQSDEPSVD
jgi:MFS family permease